jgi:hypothetical protein
MPLMSRTTIRPLEMAMLRLASRRVCGTIKSCFVLAGRLSPWSGPEFALFDATGLGRQGVVTRSA